MKIAVIMSTYNGEKYVEEQINSILAQTNVEVSLYIRDDGSSDNTKAILDQFSHYSQIHLVHFENIGNLGVRDNFLKTLQYALENDRTVEYFSFADQDDVWLPEKLAKAIEKIKSSSQNYCLYYSNKNFVDQDLKFIKKEKIKFYNDFMECYSSSLASGCTMVFNRNVAELAVNPMPVTAEFHDVWIYRLCKYVGADIIFDKNSYILYRQHGNNVCGSAACVTHEKSIKNNMKLMKSKNVLWRQTIFDEIEEYHEDEICPVAAKNIYRMKNYKRKFKCKLSLIFNRKILKRGIKFYTLWCLKILFNKI